MSAPIMKRENASTGFKSRIPVRVASGPHRPDSSKPRISAEQPAGMKSRIPILKNGVKNPKRQTPSETHSDAGKLVTTNTPLLQGNVRQANSTVVARKFSPPTSQSVPAITNKPVVARNLSPPTRQSVLAIANKSVVTRKLSPPTDQSVPVIANKSVVAREFSTSTGQSVPVIVNKSVETREFSPPTGQSVPVIAIKSVETHEFSPAPAMAGKSAVSSSRKLSSLTVVVNKPVVSRKFSTLTSSGQSTPTIAGKPVVSRDLSPPTSQFSPVVANKPVVSRNISRESTSKLANKVVERTTNIAPPVLPPLPRVQELKAAIRQTKAARYLKKMRPRNVPLPGAPQRAPKRTVLPGDYTRPKRTVGKSKLGECLMVKSLNLSTKFKTRMGRNQRLTLGPKGRAQTWKDITSMPFNVRLIKRTAYAAMGNLPRGNPFQYAIHGDEE